MTFQVTLDFKKGASFGTKVTATTEADAIRAATRFAQQNGFDQPVKKAKAVPA